LYITNKIIRNVNIANKFDIIDALFDHCLPVNAPPTAEKKTNKYTKQANLATHSDPGNPIW
jgi:hypothetical protein